MKIYMIMVVNDHSFDGNDYVPTTMVFKDRDHAEAVASTMSKAIIEEIDLQ
jgi:hypothetical protein